MAPSALRFFFLCVPGLVLIAVILDSSPSQGAEPYAPALAVFDVHDARSRGRLTKAEVDQITLYVRARLAETGGYRIVPGSELRNAIRAAKKDSYLACIDEACQIALGKEVAAQKSLGLQVLSLGAGCAVTGTVFDLRSAVSERAATEHVDCDARAIAIGFEKLTKRLSARKSPPPPSNWPWTSMFESKEVALVAVWIHATWSAASSLEREDWQALRSYYGPRGLRVVVVVVDDPGCVDARETHGLLDWADDVMCDEESAVANTFGLTLVPPGHFWFVRDQPLHTAETFADLEAAVGACLRASGR